IENVGQDKEKGKNGLNESVIKEFSDYDSLIRKFEDFISGENNKNKVGKNEKKDVPNNGNFKKSDRVEDKSSINGQNSTPNESKSVDENTLNSKKTAKVTSKDDNISNTPESSPISSEKGREISLNSHFSDIYTRALKTVSNYQNNTLKSPYPLSQGNFLNIANSETNKTLNELISTLKELIAKEEEIGKLKNNSANDFKRVLDRKIEKGGYNVRSVERDRFQFGKKESHPNSLSYGITRQRANSNS
ncbi:hypothetical protein EQH57_0356, partial [Dictyocoela roeselum]